MDEVTSIMLSRIAEVEARDENQILAELAGDTISEFIYTVETAGKRTVKLSWAGTREMARAKGNITLDEPMITETDGYVRVVVRGYDLNRNFAIFGGCHQPKKIKVKIFNENNQPIGHQEQDDPHYFTKALSKAQRNVLQAIIPADYTARMIDRFLVKAGQPPIKQLAAPKTQTTHQRTREPHMNKDKYTAWPESFSSMIEFEKFCYNRWHLQPADVYRHLGYSTRAEITETPYECFIKIKALIMEPPTPPEHS
ncbi:hypothetical protein ACFLXT_02650 [Chloroflexota bacterium]